MAKQVGQEHARVDVIMYDPHGRPWHAVLERETMAPTGPISPLFKAPFYPHQKYLRPGGQRNPVRLGIDYDQMDRDLQERHERDLNRLRKLAFKHFPGGNIQKTIAKPPAELIHAIYGDGERPMPLEVVWACQQGNRFALGFSENVPEWVEKEQHIKDFFFPPERIIARRKAEMKFIDAPEDEGEVPSIEIPSIDENIAPVNPHAMVPLSPEESAGEVPMGLGGDHSSWGNLGSPVGAGARSPLRKE